LNLSQGTPEAQTELIVLERTDALQWKIQRRKLLLFVFAIGTLKPNENICFGAVAFGVCYNLRL
jgi:hypothetical protein